MGVAATAAAMQLTPRLTVRFSLATRQRCVEVRLRKNIQDNQTQVRCCTQVSREVHECYCMLRIRRHEKIHVGDVVIPILLYPTAWGTKRRKMGIKLHAFSWRHFTYCCHYDLFTGCFALHDCRANDESLVWNQSGAQNDCRNMFGVERTMKLQYSTQRETNHFLRFPASLSKRSQERVVRLPLCLLLKYGKREVTKGSNDDFHIPLALLWPLRSHVRAKDSCRSGQGLCFCRVRPKRPVAVFPGENCVRNGRWRKKGEKGRGQEGKEERGGSVDKAPSSYMATV